MSENQSDGPAFNYSLGQRFTALVYGIVCHSLFAGAVVSMGLALFTGLSFGFGPFRGVSAVAANLLLLASFPIAHSWLLTDRGRKFMASLVPMGIGRQLSMTVFVAIGSAQLLSVFLLWSPSEIVLWRAEGWSLWVVGTAAVASWLFLGKSMSDAQLSLQTGFLGWSAVFRNRAPRYRPFPTQGVYRYVRQPIYISFSLIMWMTSVWTPDQLVLATLWTGYCIAGSALKERRYVQYFGEAFRKYQTRVPFWIPALKWGQ
jgi:protein-S-isoprenylcysteine O-methyltransferase Ste14